MLDGGSDVPNEGICVECVKLVKFLMYLVFSYGWLGLCTQPTPKEVDRWIGIGSNGKLGRVEKIKALGANGVMSGSRLRVIWMEVGGGVMRARVVSSVVVKVVLIGWEVFERWFWMGELSLEDMSMKLVLVIFFGGFWVEKLALEAIEQDDQEMEILRRLFVGLKV
ncbi:hypothetical protein Tco_0218293 [Tanacetum coccineum]